MLGTTVTLAGKSRKGKNVLRVDGALWKVVGVSDHDGGALNLEPIAPIVLLRPSVIDRRRWVARMSDTHFSIDTGPPG